MDARPNEATGPGGWNPSDSLEQCSWEFHSSWKLPVVGAPEAQTAGRVQETRLSNPKDASGACLVKARTVATIGSGPDCPSPRSVTPLGHALWRGGEGA